jgi:predicted nucleic acid-binding protein
MVVLDASPIIYYSRIGELYWLVGFYRSLKTAEAIVRETVDDARELNKPGVSAIEMALSKGWISVSELSDDEKDSAGNIAKSEGIEPEDAELIVLAIRENDILVTNDKMLRLVALAHRLKVHWATTPILVACRENKLTISQAKSMINRLVDTGLRVKPQTLVVIYTVIESTER